MGNNEEGKSSSKSDKSSSPAPSDQTNMHVYPDWAAMQAYYGPRLALPSYYNSAVASAHPPHPYIWGPPQPMMPPYGAPYAPIYSPGGVYAHPGVPLGSHSHGHGVPALPAVSEAVAAIPLSTETHTKSTGNVDRGLMKKLKGFDGLAMSIGNGNGESAEGGTENGLSQSAETEGSSDGSYGSSSGGDQTRKKRSSEGTLAIGEDGKTGKLGSPVPAREVNAASSKVLGATVAPPGITKNLVGPVLSNGMTTALELRNPPNMNAKTNPTNVPEAWVQNERELKRERRKQSNRESARRSRLRKQAEAEELAKKVESLTAENMTLKSEINRLTDNSEKLRLENATLMGKLKSLPLGQTEEIVLNNIDKKRVPPVSTENLLSRVNNTGSLDRIPEEEGGIYENSNSGTKLRQLLDTSSRADAVAAG